MNKKNNKGFSLIELIVVVAIMAVLVGVLAPTYLKYVDKTRAQKDVSAVGEFVQAIKVASADEEINKALKDKVEYTIGKTENKVYEDKTDSLTTELKTIIDDITLSSGSVTEVKVTAQVTDGKLVVTVAADEKASDEMKTSMSKLSVGKETKGANNQKDNKNNG